MWWGRVAVLGDAFIPGHSVQSSWIVHLGKELVKAALGGWPPVSCLEHVSCQHSSLRASRKVIYKNLIPDLKQAVTGCVSLLFLIASLFWRCILGSNLYLVSLHLSNRYLRLALGRPPSLSFSEFTVGFSCSSQSWIWLSGHRGSLSPAFAKYSVLA